MLFSKSDFYNERIIGLHDCIRYTDKPHHGKPTFINYSHLIAIKELVEGILNATFFLFQVAPRFSGKHCVLMPFHELFTFFLEVGMVVGYAGC